MTNNKQAEKFINKKDVLEHFFISERTLYRWQNEGLPYYKSPTGGNKYKFSEISEWYSKYALPKGEKNE